MRAEIHDPAGGQPSGGALATYVVPTAALRDRWGTTEVTADISLHRQRPSRNRACVLIILVTMVTIPSPQQVVQQHRSLLRLAVEALRQGTLHAQAYAEWRDEELDRALAPALVRKEAKRQLIAADHSVEDESSFEPEFLANLGLCLTAPGVKIRLLRSTEDHQVPVPGQSLARQIYYTQPGLPLGEADGAVAEPSPLLKLVLHWSTDEEYSLDRVYLACPMTGGETRATVASHWDEPIWRRHTLEVDGQVQAEVTDLDIHLDGEAVGSEA